MPRAASSAKRQHGAANNRDTRHENGLVGPGKRITKNKGQVSLDGAPKRPFDDASASQVPPMPTSNTNGFARHHDDMPPEHKTAGTLRRGSVGAYSESSSADSMISPPAQPLLEERHRSINVNDAKNSNVHRDSGPIGLAFTVLRSCPLHDTIAILIILMQVSPVALTTIYMLFTFLTFVPPVTTSSGLSITEIFDGNQGTPSLTTLLCMDVIMLGIWVFLWAPMQQFILDLAQVVISLTLGGGGTSRQGTANNIVLCVLIVGFSHWTRYSKWSSFSSLSSVFGSKFLPSGVNGSLESTIRSFERKSSHGWIRSVLAIHILTQGLVRYIREWYLRREKRDLQSQNHQDPEAAKLPSLPSETSTDGGFTATDTEASQQPSTTFVSTKKRRKQSAQVRIRQPLWAALASTKIVMVKEYELSHAASESAGSNATDIHNLGNAPFNTQPEQIWVCYVGCDEVCFSTSHFPDPDDNDTYDEDDRSVIDTTKPFYVRVNNAVWQPTRIIAIEEGEEEERVGARWTGDIYGLTPLSSYEFEFVSTRTGEVIFSTSVRTVQAKARDSETAAKASSSQRSRVRHDSPATTLKASIAAAEAKLADEKARLKAARKDNNRKLNAAKKEIEKLSTAVQSAGGNDEKLRQKVAQNNIQQKQSEQSILDLETELKEFETVPEDLLGQYRAKQATWTSEKAQFDGARASFKSFKSSIDKEIKALEEEQASLKGKRGKIATRIAKVDSDHARITDANARGLNEVERRRHQRAALEGDVARVEHHFNDRISRVRSLNADKQTHIQGMAAQMQAYLSSFQDELGYEQATSAAPSAFNPVPWAAPAASSGFPQQSMWPPAATSRAPQAASLLPPHQFSPFPAAIQPVGRGTPPHKSRGRSSSMLSDVSGFTQSTDDDDDDHTSTAANSNGNAKHPAATPPTQLHTRYPGSGGGGNFNVHSTPPFSAGRALGGGYGFVRSPLRSDGGSGSGSGSGQGSILGSGRSSLRSGSGSGGSLRDPTSPI